MLVAEIVTVLYPHTALEDTELTLDVNDEVTVLEKGENGKWRGRLGDKEGLFPSRCVQLLKPGQSSSVSMYVCKT